MSLRTLDQTISNLPKSFCRTLGTPAYTGSSSEGIALAVECMKRHMSNEGWQFMLGLEHADYPLYGFNIHRTGNLTDVEKILEDSSPGVVVVQDKREWGEGISRTFGEPRARFTNLQALKDRSDIFTLTVVRDAHHNPEYHAQSAEELGVNAWVVFYNPRIVHHLAPYTRLEHIVRTYNSIDKECIPKFLRGNLRKGCLLSGAVSSVYPLRQALRSYSSHLPETSVLRHPGYHANGSNTPSFLHQLNQYKVAVCTSSIYGYALRKIIEATACGCLVITDLPRDEVLPGIDDNLLRVSPSQSLTSFPEMLRSLYASYNEERQRHYAEEAKKFYDYRVLGSKLAKDIEDLRCTY